MSLLLSRLSCLGQNTILRHPFDILPVFAERFARGATCPLYEGMTKARFGLSIDRFAYPSSYLIMGISKSSEHILSLHTSTLSQDKHHQTRVIAQCSCLRPHAPNQSLLSLLASYVPRLAPLGEPPRCSSLRRFLTTRDATNRQPVPLLWGLECHHGCIVIRTGRSD